MRRRLLLTICGTVLVTLVVAGLGTLALARLASTSATQRDLERQVESLASVFEEANLLGIAPEAIRPDGLAARQLRTVARRRLQQLTTNLQLEEIGFLYVSPNGVLEGDPPADVALGPAQRALLVAGESVSGHQGGLVYAATPGSSRLGDYVIVVARRPESVIAPATGWFLLSAAGTLLVGALVAVRLSRRLTRPLVDARDATRRIAGGDLAARVADPQGESTDELSELSRSINEMAEHLERSRGLERQFLMSVSHDLRTPMSSIQGYAEALTDEAIDAKRAGEVILTESRRLDRLVTDLLLLARLDARSFSVSPASVDLRDMLRAVANGFAPRSGSRGVDIALDLADGPLLARADGDRLAQVMANLIENALKFAASQIVVSACRDGPWMVVSVADDGPGIAPEDLPHVFERLYVARHRPHESESGSGLGLAIVRDLVGAMGGHVHARSPGRHLSNGTEMLIALPPA